MDIQVPLSELEITYVRSSGPGGQNVNKVNSKAVVRWNIPSSACLSEFVRAKLLSKLGPRLTREGDLLITSDTFRDQIRNREECLIKLHIILKAALTEPKHRKKSKPSKSSVRRGKEKKKLHSQKKQMRRGRFDD